MLKLDDNHLLMIEPGGPSVDPVDDDLTDKVIKAFATAERSEVAYRGSIGAVAVEHRTIGTIGLQPKTDGD